MRNFFRKKIQGKNVLVIFLLTNLVYFFMIFITIPRVVGYAQGLNLFDMMPTGYSVGYAHTLLDALGADGRSAYLFAQLPVDMVYPFLFGLTYSLLIAYYVNKIQRFEKPLFYLAVFPMLAGLFDYLENAGIISMIMNYPDVPSFTIRISNLFTIAKSVFSTISFTILIILLSIFIVRKTKSRHRISGS